MKESGWLDSRLYDDVFLLAHILCCMSSELTESDKEKLKSKFLKDEYRRNDIYAEKKNNC